jgi:hypothetical protein
MPVDKDLDPSEERAEATKAMRSTPISGKDHEYRADGDHRPRPDATSIQGESGGGADGASGPGQPAAAEGIAEEAPRISEGIPGGSRTVETRPAPGERQDDRKRG